MPRIALRFLNGIYSWMLSTIILTSSIYAVYSIWDNAQVYQAAEDVQNEIRKLKPVVPEDNTSPAGPGFDDLRAVNEDVIGWISVDGTNIDYPVLQGDNNLEYMDKDVYGNFSMAGSIFLDIRNNPDFSDNYSLIYGHNMDEHLMFGDIALFKNKEFFEANNTAQLILPTEVRDMSVAAILQISAGTNEIFNPYKWSTSLNGLGQFLEKESIYYSSYWIDMLKNNYNDVDVVSLVTCSSGSTNDRSVLILIRKKPKKDSGDEPDPGPGGDDITGGDDEPGNTGDNSNPYIWIKIMVISFFVIVATELFDRRKKKF